MLVAHSEPVSSLMFGFQKASFPKPSSTLTSSFRGHQHSFSWKIRRWCAIAQSCKWYRSTYNVELRIWNVELVGFADYIIMNYSIKNIIQYLFPLVKETSSLREQPATQSTFQIRNYFPSVSDRWFHIICWLISFARLCNGASALYFPREWMLVSSERGC